MAEWQPIETAPRDGQSLIVARFPYTGRFPPVMLTRWVRKRHLPGKVMGWRKVMWEPTHWMPLPAPPSSSGS
jgi:hypothetical protein